MRKELICLLAAGVVLWAGQSLQAYNHTTTHCYNCHIPHNAGNVSVPLWNPTRATTKTFTMYTSPTFANLNPVVSAQPDGATQLCLGCHDGTGVHNTAAVTFGPNLNNMHPVSVVYDATLSSNSKGLLNNPISALSNLPGGGTIDTDLLDVNHEVQCTTCHDIHKAGVGNFASGGFTTPDGINNFFLRYAWDPTVPNDNVMCRVCHNK